MKEIREKGILVQLSVCSKGEISIKAHELSVDAVINVVFHI
jgi:hypothetical protein